MIPTRGCGLTVQQTKRTTGERWGWSGSAGLNERSGVVNLDLGAGLVVGPRRLLGGSKRKKIVRPSARPKRRSQELAISQLEPWNRLTKEDIASSATVTVTMTV
ncbi:hypothetical protein HL42_0793 [Trichophyton rubrum]|nr:hypothetical protein HL42_0793 [Trichophyton rubrum]